MASEEKVLAAIDDSGQGLRVVFYHTSDRWAHRIEHVDGAQATVVWKSREGSAHDDWPASPALQDISVERLPDGRDVIFLVGKAGNSHWSASVEAIASPPQLIFDIACRHGAVVGALGSTYERVTAHPSCTIAQSDLVTTRVASNETLVTISPEQVHAEKTQQTTRWKYVARMP